MAKLVSLTIEGLPDLRKKMKRVSQKILNDYASDGTLKAADIVADQVYATTPRDTGILARNIFTQKGDVKRKHSVRSMVMVQVGERTQQHNIMTGEFMSTGVTAAVAQADPHDAYYWKFVSRGTRYIEANPWIEDSANAMANDAVDEVYDAIIKGLRTEFDKVKKK